MSETQVKLRDLNACWRQRWRRLPARFGSHLNFMAALDTTFPETDQERLEATNQAMRIAEMSEAEAVNEFTNLVAEIEAAAEVPMPGFEARNGHPQFLKTSLLFVGGDE